MASPVVEEVVASEATGLSKFRGPTRLLGFLIFFVGLGAFAQFITARSSIRDGSAAGAPPNTFRLNGDADQFKSLDPNCPTLLLLGSSQAGSVTSPVKGGQVAWEAPGTLIDQLATQSGYDSACFVRLVLGAILPAEMAVYAGYQIEKVARPKVVLMELHWESLAYDNVFRAAPRQLLLDRDFRERFFADLRAAQAPPGFVSVLDEKARKADAEAAAAAALPPGALIDAPVTAAATRVFPWLSNLNTQTAMFRFVFLPFMGLLTGGSTTNVHAVVPTHLNMNFEALRGLVAYLKYKSVPVIVFLGPRRHDLPPMTRLDGEEAKMGKLRAEIEAMGATVLDLRKAVPDDQFGWAGDSPDRMHYGLPGHRTVAERLLQAGRSAGAFKGLERAP